MKNIISSIKLSLLVLFVIGLVQFSNAQTTDKCNIMGSESRVDLVSTSGTSLDSIKTGLDFNLNLTLPGLNGCNGNYEVLINTSSNLVQGTTAATYPYPFVNSGVSNQYTNASVLPTTGAGGIGINIPFKFKPGTTCDKEAGRFNVIIRLTCADGSKHDCNLIVNLNAIAHNYWKVEKKHVFGTLPGGGMYWDIILRNTNPNPGIGDLDIYSGSLKDLISSDAITSVSGGTGGAIPGLTGLNTSSILWSTGHITSTTREVIYHVMSYSCKPAGTTVTNCVEYNFCLGKEVSPIIFDNGGAVLVDDTAPRERTAEIEKSSITRLSGVGTQIGPIQRICCDRIKGEICDKVKLVGTPTTSANFSKTLTYGNNLNYSQGCEGEYQIIVSNNGNIPLNNLLITDNNFPAGINVFQIDVSASNTDMNYDVPTGSTTTGFNTLTGPNYSQTWTSGFPTHFTMHTTSGALLGGFITIRIKFRITANTGTLIKNCANLTYSGTYDGWSDWCGIQLPPPSQNIAAEPSCIQFTVQAPKAIPGIEKCIPTGQQTFSVGDIIPFRIVISNHGSASFSGNLTDFLGLPQNLELDLSTPVTYTSGIGNFNPYSTTPGCISPQNIPYHDSWSHPQISASGTPLNNLSWNISNMPGNCSLDSAYYLIIDFKAKVLPQSFGNYSNKTKLTTPFGSFESSTPYNIMRVARIVSTKTVSTSFVEPGQNFNYIVKVKNDGSVGLNSVFVADILPECVRPAGQPSAIRLNPNGGTMSGSVPVAVTIPNYQFTGIVLQPGETIQLTIPVSRNSNDANKECCNLKAKASGITIDAAAQPISDESDKACVVSSLCCNIKSFTVDFNTGHVNGKIVPSFLITAGPLPIQEIEISLVDYHVEYSNSNCKPDNIGSLAGHIQPFIGQGFNFNFIPGFGTGPFLNLQTVINPVNNSLTWSGVNPISLTGAWNFNGLIAINFIAPEIVNLDCCTGKVYYCFKVRVKDVNCNVCEKIVCGSDIIPKKGPIKWKNEDLKKKFQLQSLEGGQQQDIKSVKGESLLDLFKRNKKQ